MATTAQFTSKDYPVSPGGYWSYLITYRTTGTSEAYLVASYLDKNRVVLVEDRFLLSHSAAYTNVSGSTSNKNPQIRYVKLGFLVPTGTTIWVQQTLFQYGATAPYVYPSNKQDAKADSFPSITQSGFQFYADGAESSSVPLMPQNTGYSELLSADKYVQLRVQLQSTTQAPINATSTFRLEWEKNASGTWLSYSPDVPTLMSTLASTWRNTNGAPYAGEFYGQSFMGDGKKLMRVGFYMSRGGTPPGTISARLYAHSGVFGTSGIATGPVLATSNALVCAAVPMRWQWMYFDFDNTFTLQNGVPYVIGLTPTSITNSNDGVLIGARASNVIAGNTVGYSGGFWNSGYGADTLHEIYTATPGIITIYDSPSLTDRSATTNRLTGGTGTFTAGQVSEGLSVSGLGWAGNNNTELLYSMRIRTDALAPADVVRFRVAKDASTANMTYDLTPIFTNTTVSAIAVPASDGIGLTDTYDTSIAKVYTVSDTAGLTDASRSMDRETSKSDNQNLTDTRALRTELDRTDTRDVADYTGLLQSKVLYDQAGTTDTSELVRDIRYQDLVGLTDSRLRDALPDRTDLLGPIDTYSAVVNNTLGDVLSVTDSMSTATGIVYGKPMVWDGAKWVPRQSKAWTGYVWLKRDWALWRGPESSWVKVSGTPPL